jgi:hypothetical protein
MGLIRDLVEDGVQFVKDEIIPLKSELVKAGIIDSKKGTYEPKANLVDPLSYNNFQYGYKEKYSLLDYGKMRQISYADPIIAGIIQTRVNQVASFAKPQEDKYKIGFKIAMRDSQKKPGSGQKAKIKELQEFVMRCGYTDDLEMSPEFRKRDSFETFLRKITRDSLTFDQVAAEVVPRANGMPAEFMAIDAATIRLVADKAERRDYNFAAMPGSQGNEYGNPSVLDYQKPNTHETDHARFVQVINGQIKSTFDEFEMMFGVRNPRTDILANGYGFSEIEQIIMTITAHMNAETYNRKFFSQGTCQKGIITFEGSVPADQLESFRRQWHQQVAGVTNAWKTPIMSLGKDNKLNWTDLHSSNKDMEWGNYMEYLIKSICGVYLIDPLEIGFDISKNSSGGGGGIGLGGDAGNAERVMSSKDKGLSPLLRFIENMLNEYVIWRIDPEYEFQFVGLNVRNEKDDLDLDKTKVETFKMIDELRAEHDLPPMPKPEDLKGPGELIMNPTYIQALQGYQGITDPESMEQGMPGGGDMGGDEGGDDQAPDYENMSTEELEKELDSLEGGDEDTAKSLDVLI